MSRSVSDVPACDGLHYTDHNGEEAEQRHAQVGHTWCKMCGRPFMCLGSEELGTRLSANLLTCRRCGETIPAYSATFGLVPVHNLP